MDPVLLPVAKLRIFDDFGEHSVPLVMGQTWIGSNESQCNVVLFGSEQISDRHAVCTISRSKYGKLVAEIEDLGSSSGIYICSDADECLNVVDSSTECVNSKDNVFIDGDSINRTHQVEGMVMGKSDCTEALLDSSMMWDVPSDSKNRPSPKRVTSCSHNRTSVSSSSSCESAFPSLDGHRSLTGSSAVPQTSDDDIPVCFSSNEITTVDCSEMSANKIRRDTNLSVKSISKYSVDDWLKLDIGSLTQDGFQSRRRSANIPDIGERFKKPTHFPERSRSEEVIQRNHKRISDENNLRKNDLRKSSRTNEVLEAKRHVDDYAVDSRYVEFCSRPGNRESDNASENHHRDNVLGNGVNVKTVSCSEDSDSSRSKSPAENREKSVQLFVEDPEDMYDVKSVPSEFDENLALKSVKNSSDFYKKDVLENFSDSGEYFEESSAALQSETEKEKILKLPMERDSSGTELFTTASINTLAVLDTSETSSRNSVDCITHFVSQPGTSVRTNRITEPSALKERCSNGSTNADPGRRTDESVVMPTPTIRLKKLDGKTDTANLACALFEDDENREKNMSTSESDDSPKTWDDQRGISRPKRAAAMAAMISIQNISYYTKKSLEHSSGFGFPFVNRIVLCCSGEERKKLQDFITGLGGSVVSSDSLVNADVLVVEKIEASVEVLAAISLGKAIVGKQWLIASQRAGLFLGSIKRTSSCNLVGAALWNVEDGSGTQGKPKSNEDWDPFDFPLKTGDELEFGGVKCEFITLGPEEAASLPGKTVSSKQTLKLAKQDASHSRWSKTIDESSSDEENSTSILGTSLGLARTRAVEGCTTILDTPDSRGDESADISSLENSRTENHSRDTTQNSTKEPKCIESPGFCDTRNPVDSSLQSLDSTNGSSPSPMEYFKSEREDSFGDYPETQAAFLTRRSLAQDSFSEYPKTQAVRLRESCDSDEDDALTQVQRVGNRMGDVLTQVQHVTVGMDEQDSHADDLQETEYAPLEVSALDAQKDDKELEDVSINDRASVSASIDSGLHDFFGDSETFTPPNLKNVRSYSARYSKSMAKERSSSTLFLESSESEISSPKKNSFAEPRTPPSRPKGRRALHCASGNWASDDSEPLAFSPDAVNRTLPAQLVNEVKRSVPVRRTASNGKGLFGSCRTREPRKTKNRGSKAEEVEPEKINPITSELDDPSKSSSASCRTRETRRTNPPVFEAELEKRASKSLKPNVPELNVLKKTFPASSRSQEPHQLKFKTSEAEVEESVPKSIHKSNLTIELNVESNILPASSRTRGRQRKKTRGSEDEIQEPAAKSIAPEQQEGIASSLRTREPLKTKTRRIETGDEEPPSNSVKRIVPKPNSQSEGFPASSLTRGSGSTKTRVFEAEVEEDAPKSKRQINSTAKLDVETTNVPVSSRTRGGPRKVTRGPKAKEPGPKPVKHNSPPPDAGIQCFQRGDAEVNGTEQSAKPGLVHSKEDLPLELNHQQISEQKSVKSGKPAVKSSVVREGSRSRKGGFGGKEESSTAVKQQSAAVMVSRVNHQKSSETAATVVPRQKRKAMLNASIRIENWCGRSEKKEVKENVNPKNSSKRKIAAKSADEDVKRSRVESSVQLVTPSAKPGYTRKSLDEDASNVKRVAVGSGCQARDLLVNLVEMLGGCVVDIEEPADALVVDRYEASVEILTAITLGILIVHSGWIKACKRAGKLIGAREFLMKRPTNEKIYGADIEESVIFSRSLKFRGVKLLAGKTFYLSPKIVDPPVDQFERFLKPCGAVCKILASKVRVPKDAESWIVLANSTDMRPSERKGVKRVSVHELLDAVFSQKALE
ncbi:unnamed protein product [Notodromas monacha]|uniref:Mediator of DNA damage checkpoint protein 1 n=1 Tax=Notodromas monacha TaxID=399045 RepID=A0A7R9GCG2_9CRUS|nr:unnamed protein product [Notodromas monacha]CAG0916094.1 unnamed protein product [Notodromas monacha]